MSKKDKTPLVLKVIRWVFPRLEKISPSLALKFFLKAFLSPLHYPTPEKERKAESFAKKFSIEIANKTVQGYQWGEQAKYVLLIHGWAGRTTQFRRFIKPLLSLGYSVIGFDGPAHGNSTGRSTNVEEFAEVIQDIAKRYGPPEGVIAHSFGGVAALYAAVKGVPMKKVISIASPAIPDEIIKSYLKAINGSWATGIRFKDHVLKVKGRPFEEFTSLYLVQHLPSPIELLLVYDENDKEVGMEHAEALLKVYPAFLIKTKKLGHTRILKDDDVIRRCVTFISDSRP